MTALNDALQSLVETEQAKSGGQALLLCVQSGDGGVDFRGGAGVSTPELRFPIASISKMFTGALILQLADEGRITLDQTAQGVLTDVDLSDLHFVKGLAYGPKLTIRHLLFQTSGLADYYEGGVADDIKANRDQAYDLAAVLHWARARRPMAAPDNGRAHYSDTNFQLLGGIIEEVTGDTFANAVRDRICTPLGLANTFAFEPKRDAGDAILPLYHKAQRLDVPQTLASMGPDGGIVSNLNDLMVFLRAHLEGRLFSPDRTKHLHDWRKMTFPLQYGGGLMRFQLPSWMTLWQGSPELIGHSGASASFAYHAPQRDIFLVGTYNQTDLPKRPFGFMMQVLKMLERRA
ncbi:serine hydrolase domain-containing protein [Pontivivens insulae]|uniref:D-alanyl-D-alanine carboxypeptidase n=1 Tax=Pontivivens insulae TaxID=1639689 RepID=A0A2R8AG86_9RHOB|nr:serine hydrolase domain-containing protein [Pontivivens insulae]RED10680.1 CubicO group peptidase (beta-lactamase class C family) [Pontivivens insulae]SPF31108.1 D-alanyl-D-alanine carboxypeptidase [Pontivivens insulae]